MERTYLEPQAEYKPLRKLLGKILRAPESSKLWERELNEAYRDIIYPYKMHSIAWTLGKAEPAKLPQKTQTLCHVLDNIHMTPMNPARWRKWARRELWKAEHPRTVEAYRKAVWYWRSLRMAWELGRVVEYSYDQRLMALLFPQSPKP